MRLVPRQRRRQRAIAPRIDINQAEIDADLEYRGGLRRLGRVQATAQRGRR